MRKTTKEKAIETAFKWHGGMATALYSFASCGGVVHTSEHLEKLRAEVAERQAWVADVLATSHRRSTGMKDRKEYGKEPARLAALLAYINKQPIKGNEK